MELNITLDVCRVCLTKEGSFQSIFLKENSSIVSMQISEMLSACATINVKEGDGLPDQICSECSKQTVKLYLFKLKCGKNDIILRKRLEKGKAETVEIKYECYNNSINENGINDFQDFQSEICQENINQDDLLTNQEKVEDKKEEKLEIIEEDIEIKYNPISPLLMESKESLFSNSECDSVILEKENLEKNITEFNIKKEPEMSCDEVLKTEHKLTEINSLLKNKPHGCDICFEGFSQKSKLKKHMKTHNSTSKETDKQLSISNVVCDKGFSKSYECDMCEKTFKFSSALMIHRRIHTGEKPLECEICNKKFSYSSVLKRHKIIHTGEKPYKCKVCKKRFTYSSDFTCHKRVHTGEKPFECEMCNKKFIKSSNLMRHKRIHTGEKPYECDVCNKRFAQWTNLNSHKRVHTGEKPFECEICNKKFT